MWNAFVHACNRIEPSRAIEDVRAVQSHLLVQWLIDHEHCVPMIVLLLAVALLSCGCAWPRYVHVHKEPLGDDLWPETDSQNGQLFQ